MRSLSIRASHDLEQSSAEEGAGRGHSFLARLFWTLYLLLSALQVFAVAGGVHRTFDAPLWIAAIVAFIVGPWPVIGTALGVAGAHYGWGLTWSVAAAMFLSLAIPIAGIVIWASRSVSGRSIFFKGSLSLRRSQ